MAKIIAVVGMPGCGKTEVVERFVNNGFSKVYFGDVTFDEIKRQNLEVNEKNERATRERIRKEHGMEAYAKLSLPRIEKGLETTGKVVVESLYSFEEYQLIKKKFGNEFAVLAVTASPTTRYNRLKGRPIRPLTPQEVESRDVSQIENLHQGGPIAMADFVIVNEGTKDDLVKSISLVIKQIQQQVIKRD